MNLEDAERIIEEYTRDNWTSTKIAYPATLPLEQAVVGTPILPQGDADFLALRYLFDSSEFITVPGSCRRVYGQIHLTICMRPGSTTTPMRSYAKDIMSLYEGKEIRDSTGVLRTWGMTGSVELPFSGWNTREMVFGASFERYVSV